MVDWIKARLGEGNSRRAIAIVVAVLGTTHILDAEALGNAAASINQLAVLLLAVDAFATKQAPKPDA